MMNSFTKFSHVEPNYDFLRKKQKLFKAETTTLLNINFNRGILKLVPSIIEDDQNKEFQKSSKKTLGWVLWRDKTAHPSELKVAVWSSLNQTESDQNFLQASVGYLPPITTPSTQISMDCEVIHRTLSIREELGLSDIGIFGSWPSNCMFLSCHVHVSDWLHTIVAWMSRDSLLETGAISEV